MSTSLLDMMCVVRQTVGHTNFYFITLYVNAFKKLHIRSNFFSNISRIKVVGPACVFSAIMNRKLPLILLEACLLSFSFVIYLIFGPVLMLVQGRCLKIPIQYLQSSWVPEKFPLFFEKKKVVIVVAGSYTVLAGRNFMKIFVGVWFWSRVTSESWRIVGSVLQSRCQKP